MAEKITLGEMKELIKEEKILPSDLFGVESLTGDPLVRGYLDSSVKELKGKLSGEYDARKRVEKGTDETKKDLDDKMKEKDDLIKNLKTESAKVKAADLFSTKIKERKLDKKQAGYIEKRQKNFKPEDLDNVDKEVDKSMDSMLEEFKEDAKIFGHKTEDAVEKKGGAEEGKGDSSDEDSMIPD